jgi:hypothetical protein
LAGVDRTILAGVTVHEKKWLRVLESQVGDGTVTQVAAEWGGVVDADHRRACRGTHAKLMDEPCVVDFLDSIAAEAPKFELRKTRKASRETYDKLIAALAQDRRLVTVEPSLGAEEAHFAAQLNAEVIREIGLSENGVWQLRNASGKQSIDRYTWNWTYVNLPKSNNDRWASAQNEVGLQLLKRQRFAESAAQLTGVVDLWNSTSERTDRLKEIAGWSYNSRAWANARAGDRVAAQNDWFAADHLGNPKASAKVKDLGVESLF